MILDRLIRGLWLRSPDEGGGAGSAVVDGASTSAPAGEAGVVDTPDDDASAMEAFAEHFGRSPAGAAGREPVTDGQPAPAQPAAPAAPAAPAPAAPTPAAEVLGRFLPADLAASLPPEAQAALGERLQAVQDWAMQTQTYYQNQAQQLQAQYEGAIQQLQGQIQQMTGQAGSPPVDPNARPPEFESTGEQFLHQSLQQQNQVVEGLRGQIDQLTQQLNHVLGAQESHQKVMLTQATEHYSREIDQAEKVLASEYPELFGSEATRRQVYQEAAVIHKARQDHARQFGGQAPTLADVIRQACILIDAPNAAKRAQQQLLGQMGQTAGQRNLQGSPQPGGARAPATDEEITLAEAQRAGLLQRS